MPPPKLPMSTVESISSTICPRNMASNSCAFSAVTASACGAAGLAAGVGAGIGKDANSKTCP
ncbi:hypothetical protein [Sulfitobacter faviae]|uniref:hypothetical protein n=1 Tax=Sulfitobacter faviae TaxID=1775881 RepID=UPI0024568060|nr:hypothetical protein [Sulfitobacter faviae]MDH4539489.1 hypothetical protein [Sulfitobacter faviae]